MKCDSNHSNSKGLRDKQGGRCGLQALATTDSDSLEKSKQRFLREKGLLDIRRPIVCALRSRRRRSYNDSC